MIGPVFGLTGVSKRNLINILRQVLLAGGSSERVLELRILPVAGGRHRSIPGLRQRLAPDPAWCRRGSLARRSPAPRTCVFSHARTLIRTGRANPRAQP